MHLPGGFLDQGTCAATTALAAGGVGYAMHRLRHEADAPTCARMAAGGALIFTAQMLNAPVGEGVSGHLLGGALAAMVMGPWAAMVTMTVVVAAQCLLAGDGGVSTLGANVLNMACVTTLVGYVVFRSLARLTKTSRWGAAPAAACAAGLSVLAASTLCAVELAISGVHAAEPLLAAMTSTHLAIAGFEAIVSGAVMALVFVGGHDRALGDRALLPTRRAEHGARFAPGAAMFLVVLLLLAALAPLASSAPDGLESVAQRLGFEGRAGAFPFSAPLADYTTPLATSAVLSVACAGLLGALVVFASTWCTGRLAQAVGKRHN